jgi:hypothetical protein
MSRNESHAEGNRRATGKSIILIEIDGFLRDLDHVESPKHTRNGQPDLALGDDHTGTNTASVNYREQ